MKAFILVYFIAFFTILTSCRKEISNCSFTKVTVIRYDCDRVILQINNDASTNGDFIWTDFHTNTSYSNVVSCYQVSKINEVTNGEKTSFYINYQKITRDLQEAGFVQCQAISQNPPNTKIEITGISANSCAKTNG